MDQGYGKCGVCHRTIHLATPTAHVYRGVPKRAYLIHKACKEDTGPKEHPLVVSDPADFAGAQLKVVKTDKPVEPSLPTKEQTGRRKKPE